MFLLVGLSMAGLGGVTVYGSLTGRLAAILAALFKPQDLGATGSAVNGTPDIGTNAASPGGSDANLLTALVQEFNKLIKPGHPEAVAEFKKTVQPLILKAGQTRSESDYLKAINALRALIRKYLPPIPGGNAPVATSGGSTDPTVTQPPIIAPRSLVKS